MSVYWAVNSTLANPENALLEITKWNNALTEISQCDDQIYRIDLTFKKSERDYIDFRFKVVAGE